MRLPKPIYALCLLLAVVGIAGVPVYLELRRVETIEDLIDKRREILARREQMWREHETHRAYLDQLIAQNRRQINTANKSVGQYIEDPAGRSRMIQEARLALQSLWHAQEQIRAELRPQTLFRPQSAWSDLVREWANSSDSARTANGRLNRTLQAWIPRAPQNRQLMQDVLREQNVLFEEQERIWKMIQDREVSYLHTLEAELVLLDGFEKKLVSIVP